MATVSLLECNNQGCFERDYHKLDVETGDVRCNSCGSAIEVNFYTKKLLKSGGQVYKRVRTAREYVCHACGVSDVPVMLNYGKDVYEIVCKHCGGLNSHLSNFFVEAFRLNPDVQRIDVEIKDDQVVKQGGDPLPWNDPDAPPSLTEEEKQLEARAAEREEVADKEKLLRKASPATATDLLKRAGIKTAVLEEEPEEGVRSVMAESPQRATPRSEEALRTHRTQIIEDFQPSDSE